MSIRDDLARRYAAIHPGEATAMLETMAPAEAAAFVDDLPPGVAAELMHLATPQLASAVCAELPADRVARVLPDVPLAFAASALRRLDPDARERILAAVDEELGTALGKVLAFAPRSAGAFMDPRALALPGRLTADDAVRAIRASARDLLYNVYVIDTEQRLVGVLNLRELFAAEPTRPLEELMKTDMLTASVAASASAIIAHPGWRQTHSLPVVDGEGRFVGAIRYSTLRALQDELQGATADPSAPTIQALGDLFWTGVGGLITAAASAVSPRGTKGRDRVDG